MRKIAPCACLLLIAPLVAAADDNVVLDKDLRVLMEWFPGVYDNQEKAETFVSVRLYERRRVFVAGGAVDQSVVCQIDQADLILLTTSGELGVRVRAVECQHQSLGGRRTQGGGNGQ